MLKLDDKWLWDSWYVQDGDVWHAFYLQAPKSIGDPEQRHWNVSYGHAISRDLVDWEHLGTCFKPADSPAWDYFEPLWNGSGHAELGGADNSYTMQYYDLLIVTALAIEAAGSTNASDWAAAVPQVSGGDGVTVYTYAEGIEALRAGESINYSGVTGEFNYTDTGVVSGLFGIIQWVSEEDFELVSTLDDADILALDSGTYGQ